MKTETHARFDPERRPPRESGGGAQAAAPDPGRAAAHYNMGLLHLESGRLAAAADAFREACAADPHEPAALNNLGIALKELGRGSEALACFELAAEIDPGFALALCNAGRLLFGQKRWDEAMTRFRRAVDASPDHPQAWHHLGLCFHKKRDLERARLCYERVLALDPAHHAAHLDMGNVCLDRGDLAGMADWYRKALDLAPADAAASANVGRMLQDQQLFVEAMECFDRAVAINPGCADARFNRAALLLRLGRWREGWQEYEWRFSRADWRNAYPHRLPAPRWDGRPFAGRTLLVHCEQGYGDAIQFARYLPRVKALGGALLLEAPAPLTRLFGAGLGVDEVLEFSPGREPTPRFDFQMPLMSLPGIFGTTTENVPAEVPYLAADPVQRAAWRTRLGGGFKVGVVWAASGWNRTLAGKSCRLADFVSLFAAPGARFYGLQKGEAAKEAAAISVPTGFVNLGEEFADFSDTAAVIADLDLVISVDTAAAHLAGAMGKPVWALLPFCADWRWMEHREDNPWYPTMRLFRQPAAGDWESVFERVRAELHGWAARFPKSP